MENKEILELITERKMIAIIRKVYGEMLMDLAAALYDGGIRLMELTFDQKDGDCIRHTGEMIARLSREYAGRMVIGGGTVLTKEQVDAVASAGGRFIISPNTDRAVIEHTKACGLVSIPGAMTPTEILAAHSYGADIVKVFPAGHLGLSYFKDLKGPISHVKLMATGGINEGNFRDFLDVGCVGAGISGRLSERSVLEAGNYAEISARARAFCAIARGENGAE